MGGVRFACPVGDGAGAMAVGVLYQALADCRCRRVPVQPSLFCLGCRHHDRPAASVLDLRCQFVRFRCVADGAGQEGATDRAVSGLRRGWV